MTTEELIAECNRLYAKMQDERFADGPVDWETRIAVERLLQSVTAALEARQVDEAAAKIQLVRDLAHEAYEAYEDNSDDAYGAWSWLTEKHKEMRALGERHESEPCAKTPGNRPCENRKPGHSLHWSTGPVAPQSSESDVRERMIESIAGGTISVPGGYGSLAQDDAENIVDAILAAFPILSRAAAPAETVEWEYARQNRYGHVCEPDDSLEQAEYRASLGGGYDTVVRRPLVTWEPLPVPGGEGEGDAPRT